MPHGIDWYFFSLFDVTISLHHSNPGACIVLQAHATFRLPCAAPQRGAAGPDPLPSIG